MTLEIKHLVFNSLPEYLAVHGRAAAQRAVEREESPPAAAPVVEQRLPAGQRNGARPAAPDAAAELLSDANMESEHTENQNKASAQAANSADPPPSAVEEGKADANMQVDEQGGAEDVGDAGGDASEGKAGAGGSEASPLGAKRKRDDAEGNHRDGVQRISSHAG